MAKEIFDKIDFVIDSTKDKAKHNKLENFIHKIQEKIKEVFGMQTQKQTNVYKAVKMQTEKLRVGVDKRNTIRKDFLKDIKGVKEIKKNLKKTGLVVKNSNVKSTTPPKQTKKQAKGIDGPA